MTLIFFSLNSFANDIFITQSGDNFEALINQKGQNQQIKGGNTIISIDGGTTTTSAPIDGDDNYVKVLQGTSNTSNNLVELDVAGDTNSVIVLQDRTDMGNDDTTAYGNHTSSIRLLGDNNNVNTIQRNNGTNAQQGHSVAIDIIGSGTDIDVKQISDYGKTANLDIDADDVTVDIYQNGHGNHTINLDVDNNGSTFDLDQGYNPGSTGHDMNISTSGAYASTITVDQQSNTAQSYSLSQDCQTTGGCSVAVTQY
jgi:hypothetical protein